MVGEQFKHFSATKKRFLLKRTSKKEPESRFFITLNASLVLTYLSTGRVGYFTGFTVGYVGSYAHHRRTIRCLVRYHFVSAVEKTQRKWSNIVAMTRVRWVQS